MHIRNTLAGLIAVASIGCAAPRNESHLNSAPDFSSAGGVATVESAGTVSEPTPQSPALPSTYPYSVYNSFITSAVPVGLESEVARRLNKDLGIFIEGCFDEQSVRNLDAAIRAYPKPRSCTVYFLPMLPAGPTLGAWWFSPDGNVAHGYIAAVIPAPKDTLTHEYAHCLSTALGNEFLAVWSKTNTHPYNEGLVPIAGGDFRWPDGTNGARNGFTDSYGASAAMEDIANLVAKLRNNEFYTLPIASADVEVFHKKVELLLKYDFIQPSEAALAQHHLHIINYVAETGSRSEPICESKTQAQPQTSLHETPSISSTHQREPDATDRFLAALPFVALYAAYRGLKSRRRS